MAGATPTYIDIRAIIMEYYRTTTAFSRLQQSASSSAATNYNGGAAPMDIGAINKEKERASTKAKERQEKVKERKTTKEKATDNKATATQDKAKEKGPLDKQFNTKDATTMHQVKEKHQERQPAKEKDTQQAATDVVNMATRQRIAELQCTTYKRISRKVTTTQQNSGMDHRPPVTTIGGQTTKHKSMQFNNHNNWHCPHLHN